MSLVKTASASASASRPRMSHLRSADSSHMLQALRVAWCSATGSPKSAAHAQPSHSVQLSVSSRWTASNAVLCSSVVDTPVTSLSLVWSFPHRRRLAGRDEGLFDELRELAQL